MRRSQGPPGALEGVGWADWGSYGLLPVFPVHTQLVLEALLEVVGVLVAAEPAEQQLGGVEQDGQLAGGDGSDWRTQ